MINRWLVLNIGCEHCTQSAEVVGTCATNEEAVSLAADLSSRIECEFGGLESFRVVDLTGPMAAKYAKSLPVSKPLATAKLAEADETKNNVIP